MTRIRSTLTLLLFAVACQTPQAVPTEPARPATPQAPEAATTASTTEADEYATLPPEQRESPPPAGPTPSWAFPRVQETKLDNGLSMQLVERRGLPLVEIKLVVESGQATDGQKAGSAVLAGEMLKVGGSGPYASRQLLGRVESLGSDLQIITSRDATSITLSVTSDRLDDAMDLLGLIVRQPQFSAAEFRKLKRREIDRVSSAAKSDPNWAANMVMYRELYAMPQATHPYADFDATAEEIEQRQLWEIQAWYRTHFKPENAFLVLVGDVSADAARAATERALGGWRGKAPAMLSYPAPSSPEGLKLVLIDRPKSTQAEVRLALFGPERQSPDWVPMKVINQVLGGGVSGRMFLDIREKQSLAYSAYSTLIEVAHGPCPIMLRAGTQTAKAGLTLKALLDHSAQLSAQPPTQPETEIATRYLSDVFLVSVETVGDVAGLTARLGVFGLPHDYYDRYREQVRLTEAEAARQVFAKYVQPRQGLVVVAGDAERLAAPLSHFGEVEVRSTDENFKTIRTVPHDPAASIELPRIDGT